MIIQKVFALSKISWQWKFFPKKIWLVSLSVPLLPLISFVGKGNTPYNSYYFKEIDKSAVESNQEYGNLSNVPWSYGKLLLGTKDYHGGNYLIYLGTEACSGCMKLLFNNANFNKGKPQMGSGAHDASWSFGGWGKAIQQSSNLQKFLMYEDIPESSINYYDDERWQLPFKKNDGSNYVRYDQSAVVFREIYDFARSIYSAIDGVPVVLAYKNGIGHLWKPTTSGGEDNEVFQNFCLLHYKENR